ncbi:serine/threonine protein kinase [Thecamonas trahens ATCC 50062]|uniref:Serine/threonine protein kinase n=1 Tax=Thecamonas trahens ATCC 50062 TaxID=461836 RepID=A0A0L0D950_THETB|nr:serine/threonine protein kinase [Thecamonas trahens ATCC 50062]KNC48765.1 serine/threonine protein kinase [Thecamonas trahens ATCC 50062]|eukprot:XP_013762816.1 serine/threonine protein kinase [Thecamonas trahens ATCC 50062]
MDSAESMSEMFQAKVDEYGSRVERELYRLMYRIKQTVDNKRSAHDHSVIVQQSCEEMLWKYNQLVTRRKTLLQALEARLLATGSFSAIQGEGGAGRADVGAAVPSSSVLSPKSFEPSESVIALQLFEEIAVGVPHGAGDGDGAGADALGTSKSSGAQPSQAPLMVTPASALASVEPVQVLEPLGDSILGVLYHGLYRGAKVAVRKVAAESPVEHAAAVSSASGLCTVANSSLVPVLGYSETCPTAVYVVYEFSHASPLSVLIRKEGGLLDEMDERVSILHDVVCAVAALHKAGRVHANLNLGNVLVQRSRRGQVTGAYLTSSAVLVPTKLDAFERQVMRGKHMYYPPEILATWMSGESVEATAWTQAADVYALGVLAYELFTGIALAEHAQHFTPEALVAGTRPMFPQGFVDDHPGVGDLVEACWDADAAKRPDCTSALQLLKTMQFTVAFDRVF